jgi:hypothetical protein
VDATYTYTYTYTSNILALGGTGSPPKRVSFSGYLHANAMRISKPQIAPKSRWPILIIPSGKYCY